MPFTKFDYAKDTTSWYVFIDLTNFAFALCLNIAPCVLAPFFNVKLKEKVYILQLKVLRC